MRIFRQMEQYNPPNGKRWRLYILPQYLANLTQPIGTLKVVFFYEILSCTNSNVYARFEVFKSFLCVFMSVLGFFVRNELWVKLPVAILFGGFFRTFILGDPAGTVTIFLSYFCSSNFFSRPF